MTFGRTIMAISTLLAVAACADRGREAASSADHDKAAREIATTIPSESDDAALPPRESGGAKVSSKTVVIPIESPPPKPAVEPMEQPRDDGAAEARDQAAETAKPPEPRDQAPEPPKPADTRESVGDGAKSRRSPAAAQVGETSEGQVSVVGNNVSVAMSAEAPPTTADEDQAEQPASDAPGSPTVQGNDDVAEISSASVVGAVSEAPTGKGKAPGEPGEKIGIEATAEAVVNESGSTIAAGDPGVDDLNRTAASPPDSPDKDAVAEARDEQEPETMPANQPLKCDIVRLLGQSIGQWRLRGESSRAARRKAADEVARKIETMDGERLSFKTRVYADRIYDLKPNHTLEGFAAYAHAACMIYRGHKGLIPVDETSRDMLDQALRGCESAARGEAELDACIRERMETIVRERGRRSG